MYRKHFGLINKPFDLSPDSEMVYLSDVHREALAMLRYGVIADKGFLMLTGGVGTGKTTLLNSLIKSLPDTVRVCLLNNPTLNRKEFYSFLGGRLGVSFEGDKGEFLLGFLDLLERCRANGEKILIIIDEAQAFSLRLLEEMRLLSNQAGEYNVLSIFLVGQPELREVIANPRLLPLRQRIGITFHLQELGREDTAHYVAFRLNKAGAANPALFTDGAIDAIHRASHGNPRLINIICDHALISGFAADLRVIDAELIDSCLDELMLPGEFELSISDNVGTIRVGNRRRKRRERSGKTDPALVVVFSVTIALGFLYYIGWIGF